MGKYELGIWGERFIIDINWYDRDDSYGHIIIEESADHKILLDGQGLSKEKIKEILCDLVDQAILEE